MTRILAKHVFYLMDSKRIPIIEGYFRRIVKRNSAILLFIASIFLIGEAFIVHKDPVSMIFFAFLAVLSLLIGFLQSVSEMSTHFAESKLVSDTFSVVTLAVPGVAASAAEATSATLSIFAGLAWVGVAAGILLVGAALSCP